MADYIKREDALKAMEWKWAGKSAIEAVKEIPSADVVEVRHGKWEENSRTSISERHRQIHYSIYKCSRCNHANGRYKSNFCPNCGADMRQTKDGK